MSFIQSKNVQTGVGPKIAVSLFDQAVAALGSNLISTMKADRAVGNQPVNRTNGTLFGIRNNGPVVIPNDPDFGHDSLKYTDVNGSNSVFPRVSALPSSYTVGIVWAPDVDPVTTAVKYLFNITLAGTYGGFIQPIANQVVCGPQTLGGALVTITGRNNSGTNFTMMSVDAVGRSIAVWHNSLTPSIVSGGVNPYPTFVDNSAALGGFGQATTDQSFSRIGTAFLYNGALHASANGLILARDLVETCADVYNVNLY